MDRLGRVAALALVVAGCAPRGLDLERDAVRGMVLSTWLPERYEDPVVRDTVRRMRKVGVDHVAVLSTWYQEDVTSVEIAAATYQSPTEQALRLAVQEVQRAGLRSVLKPHVDLYDGVWRGELVPDDVEDWFASYEDFLLWHAELAEEEGVDALVVGTELESLVHEEAAWRDVIAGVREAFGGDLIYAANWDGYQQVPWWDAVDVVGVDAYFPLSDSLRPTDGALQRAWRGHAEAMDAYGASLGMPVVLSEVGYQDRDGTNRTPWWVGDEETRDLEEQAACFDAMLLAVAEAPTVVGAFVWRADVEPETDLDGFDVLGKPAEAVLRAHWR